ncbi:hypothetical protein GF412_02960 [Candidatus Micrarchaeota archaeon]|nr:hypothetical protein [Candidatus Micrarchaeota archaeon]MBD3417912.1 hypothetical protein [Candidatus Micrarchaeota archaeon]
MGRKDKKRSGRPRSRDRNSSDNRRGGRSRDGGYSRDREGRGREGGRREGGYIREGRQDRDSGAYGSKPGRGRSFNRDRPRRYSGEEKRGEGRGKFGAGFDRSKFIKKAREKTTEVLRSRDMYLAYLSNAIEEEERVANQLVERLEELYGLYFPELKIDDRRNYVLIISKIKRDKVDVQEIAKYVGEGKARQIEEAGKNSVGGDFTEKDVVNMQKMAEEIENIYALMNRHEKYLDDVAQEVCPNLRYLIGAKITGKLVAAAGGLGKLALMPASTVQVIGAEKALFKHLKNRSIAPPKHGIIFQHAAISTAPKKVRGKIARALATKITLAAKADGYTKRFIGPEIKDKFDKRLKDILAKAK